MLSFLSKILFTDVLINMREKRAARRTVSRRWRDTTARCQCFTSVTDAGFNGVAQWM